MNIYLERLSKNELGLWGIYSNELYQVPNISQV